MESCFKINPGIYTAKFVWFSPNKGFNIAAEHY